MNKLKRLNVKGFTIVELLIVIVIIGILATIGFVSFANAQNKAKKSKAEATVAQVKSKLGEYYAENNYYPGTKGDLVTFMNANGAESTASEFNVTTYGYDADPDGCTTAAEDCTEFTLTASGSYWNNDAETITVTE